MILNWANNNVRFTSSVTFYRHLQKITLISELGEKCYHFIKVTPNLGRLDFHSEGILQLCPSWNLIIIMEERMTLSTIYPAWWGTYFWCCFLLPFNPVERATAERATTRWSHSNYYNSAPKVVTGGRQLYPQHQPSVTQGNHKHSRAHTN